ncbi:MAG: ABC transporter substrate-binding protein, partial [Sphingomonadaceae bacterium]
MTRSIRLLILAAAGFASLPAEARPQRIVSLNLCADQYLMALADPQQIAALTPFARDPDMSAGAAMARKLPVARGHAEEVLARNPD